MVQVHEKVHATEYLRIVTDSYHRAASVSLPSEVIHSWRYSSHDDVPGDLDPVSQYSRKLPLRCFGDGLLDDRICDPVTTKTVRHDCNRIAFDPGKVLAKRLSDVETDKRLI